MESTATTSRTKQLVDALVRNKKQEQKLKIEKDTLLAELTEIAERSLADKGIKSTVMYGAGGNGVIITSPVKVNVVSYEKLIAGVGEQLVNEYAPFDNPAPVREPKKEFMSMCANVVLDQFLEADLEQFLTTTFKDMTAEKCSLLLKKLKGDYAKDSKVLVSVFGPGDYDVELYHISRILNYKNMQLFLPSEMKSSIDAIKSAVAVDEGVKAEIFFKD